MKNGLLLNEVVMVIYGIPCSGSTACQFHTVLGRFGDP